MGLEKGRGGGKKEKGKEEKREKRKDKEGEQKSRKRGGERGRKERKPLFYDLIPEMRTTEKISKNMT